MPRGPVHSRSDAARRRAGAAAAMRQRGRACWRCRRGRRRAARPCGSSAGRRRRRRRGAAARSRWRRRVSSPTSSAATGLCSTTPMRISCGKSVRRRGCRRPRSSAPTAASQRVLADVQRRLVERRLLQRGADLRLLARARARDLDVAYARRARSRAATASRRRAGRRRRMIASIASAGRRGSRASSGRGAASGSRLDARLIAATADVRPRPTCGAASDLRREVSPDGRYRPGPSGDQAAAERVDVAGAEREQQVAVAQRGAQEALGVVEPGSHATGRPPAASAAAAATSRPVTPGKSSARSRAG